MEDIKTLLQQVIDCQGDLDIVYQGGTSPGTIRRIAPLKILDDAKLAAYCRTSGAKKTFMLNKIALPDEHHTGEVWQPKQKTAYPDGLTLEDFAQALVSTGKLDHVHIVLMHRENSEDVAVAVHRFYKNGKPRKRPDIWLKYEQYRTDQYTHERVERARKWIVESPLLATDDYSFSRRAFGKIGDAIDAFMPLLNQLKQ